MTWLRPLRSIDSLSLGIIAHILRLLRRTRCRNTMFCHTQLILCVAMAVFATKAAVVSIVVYSVFGLFYLMGVISW